MITVTNTSEQRIKFHYTEFGRAQFSILTLGPGRQDYLDKDNRWGGEETQYVINQMIRLGARDKDTLKHKADTKFHGLVFSMSKPLTETQIHDGHDKVLEGREITSAREAVAGAMRQDVIINGPAKNGGKRRSRETQVTIEEGKSEIKNRAGNEVRMDLTISPDGHDLRMPG
jgi:hypothetical protein